VNKLEAGRQGFDSWQGQRFFSSPPWGSFPEEKWPEHEAHYSPPSCVEVKIAWSYNSTTLHICMVWCLIKHKRQIYHSMFWSCRVCQSANGPVMLYTAHASMKLTWKPPINIIFRMQLCHIKHVYFDMVIIFSVIDLFIMFNTWILHLLFWSLIGYISMQWRISRI
jgi:hypothetical protein